VGALKEPKHEAFARFIVQGKSKRDAAIAAGYSKKSATSFGSQLARKIKITKRIRELQGKPLKGL
jgi:phage terminase small subunit